MPERRTDNRALLRRTLITVGAMVGAKIVIVGIVTLVVVLQVRSATAPPGEADRVGGSGTIVPATNVHGAPPPPMARPPVDVPKGLPR